MRVLFYLFIFFCGSLSIRAQEAFNSKNTAFLHGGYIRTGYTEGELHIQSDQYDITVSRVGFSDSDEKTGAKDFFNFSSVNQLQYTIQGGYFFWDYIALTVGVSNHVIYKNENQGVHLSGTLEANSHPTYNGTSYEDFVINPSKQQLFYAQKRGVRFLSVGVLTSHYIPLNTPKDQFSLMGHGGIGFGPLFSSSSTYNFGDNLYFGKAGYSGLGVAVSGGFRAIFLNHVYLQAGLNGGYFSHSSIQLNRNGEHVAQHRHPFLSPELSGGVIINF